jgi:hypothetical protein
MSQLRRTSWTAELLAADLHLRWAVDRLFPEGLSDTPRRAEARQVWMGLGIGIAVGCGGAFERSPSSGSVYLALETARVGCGTAPLAPGRRPGTTGSTSKQSGRLDQARPTSSSPGWTSILRATRSDRRLPRIRPYSRDHGNLFQSDYELESVAGDRGECSVAIVALFPRELSRLISSRRSGDAGHRLR